MMVGVTDYLTDAATAAEHDLKATGQWNEAAAAAVGSAVGKRSWWLEQWPAGGEHLLGLIGQDVQEWMHDTIDHDWPRCSEHHDHALLIEPDLGPDPFWVCHRSGLPVARVGELPQV